MAVKKKLFKSNYSTFTVAGSKLNKRASEFLESIYDEYMAKGYSPIEIDSLLMFALVNASAVTGIKHWANHE